MELERANKKAYTFDPERPLPGKKETDALFELTFTEIAIVIAKRVASYFSFIPNGWIARFVAEIYNGLYRRDPKGAEDLLNGFNGFLAATETEIKENLEEDRKRRPTEFHLHYTHVMDIQDWVRTIRNLAIPHIPSLNEETK